MPDDFDPAMIQSLIGDIGADSAREVLDLFFEDSAEKLALLRAGGNACDPKLAQRHAHALKSAAATFGFTSLSILAGSLEVDAHGLSVPEIAARAQSLGDALARARGFSQQP
jgi:HPt (histidine-containing phosphotransfer) domain-containing protein